jgi:hypothetical protein
MTDTDIITARPGVVANTIRQSVTRATREVILSRQLFRIFLLVAEAKYGITPERLFDVIYRDSIGGGPLTGSKTMQVQRVNLNKKLEPLCLTIKSGGPGRAGGVYELEVLPLKAELAA